MRRGKIFIILLLGLMLCFVPTNSDKTIKASGYEHAWYPVSVMNLTQIAYESFSHGNSMHFDCVGSSKSTYAFAPFTGKVVAISPSCNTILFQSTNKVHYPDGTLDYMTVVFMHGSNYSQLLSYYNNGTIISQGNSLYKIGDTGSPGAIHFDIGIYKGKKNTLVGPFSGIGNTYPFDGFYINPNKTHTIYNKGILESGNFITHNAPTDYSNLWVTLGSPPNPSNISVKYQVYDHTYQKWLPNVIDTQDYSGIYGHAIDGVYASLSSGNITYKVHYKGGSWLPEVTNRNDYAGIKGMPIDGIMFKTDTGKTIHYRVHLKSSNKWLPYVTGYNQYDSNNGYAGVFGQEIDAIQIYID